MSSPGVNIRWRVCSLSSALTCNVDGNFAMTLKQVKEAFVVRVFWAKRLISWCKNCKTSKRGFLRQFVLISVKNLTNAPWGCNFKCSQHGESFQKVARNLVCLFRNLSINTINYLNMVSSVIFNKRLHNFLIKVSLNLIEFCATTKVTFSKIYCKTMQV